MNKLSRLPLTKKRAVLVTKYALDWSWHFRLDGTMWISCLKTGKVIEVGRVE